MPGFNLAPMSSTHAAIALTLSMVAASWMPMSIMAGSAVVGAAWTLAAVTFFIVGRWAANKSIAQFGYQSSRWRVLLRLAVFAIVIPNLLTALLYSTILDEGSSGEMGRAARGLWVVLILPISVVLAAYHGVPTILGGTLLQTMGANAPMPMWSWLIALSAVFYAFLGALFVLAAHARTRWSARKHRAF
jgi:hypothetical protein